MISGMRNFHETLWIFGSFIRCLVKRGRGHIFVFLVSTMRIFSKLFLRILTTSLLLIPSGRMEISNNANMCHHCGNEAAGRGTFPKNDRDSFHPRFKLRLAILLEAV